MPRNGSGTYTLPEAAFVPNTVISSNAVNTDLSDIATALTDSLSADGQTPLTGRLLGVNGSLGAPSWSFNNDPASGVYLPALSELGLVAGGVGVLVDGAAFAASGAPAISAAGSGYVVGDQITLTGGTFTNPVVVQVATLSGSGIATVTLVEAGRYTVKPSNPVAQGSTTGAGTGATFTVSWAGALAVTDLSGGQLWSALGATAFAKNQLLLANSTAAILGAQGVTAYNLAASTISPNVTMVNGTLVQSNNGTAQTFAIKTLAGTDPTSTNPVYFVFRDVALGTGGYNIRSVTAALSIVIPNGQTMNLTTSAGRIWIGAIDNGGTVELFVFNAFAAGGAGTTTIYSLQGWGTITTAAVSGASSSGVFYSTAARVSKPYVTLGYATWESGIAVPGTWNTNPSRMYLYQPGVTPLPGTTIQRTRSATGAVSTTASHYTPSDTAPTNAVGATPVNATINPTSGANVIHISAKSLLACDAGVENCTMWIWNGSSTIAATNFLDSSAGGTGGLSLDHEVLANTTAGIAYSLYGAAGSGTLTFNGSGGVRRYGGAANTYIAVEEIMA